MIRTTVLVFACLSTCAAAPLSQAASGDRTAKPKVAAFEILWRQPAGKSRRFTSASVTFQTSSRLRRRALVTIVPLSARLRPFAARVSSVKRTAGCSDISQLYTVRIAGIRRRSILTVRALKGRRAEAPFDVVVIYPANGKARFLPMTPTIRASLPAKIFRVRRITRAYAVDLTGNGRPDLVFVEDNFKGDYTRSKTWHRGAKGWRTINSTQPC